MDYGGGAWASLEAPGRHLEVERDPQIMAFLKRFQYFILFLLLSLCVYVCAYECSIPRDQKRVSEPLELESLAVVSHLIWALGTKLRFCKGRTYS